MTYDIIPCGRHINVTNDDKYVGRGILFFRNKIFRIVYIHRMSVYRTYTRIKNQIKMFTEGFKILMKPEWINMFSVPELQQLISGESSDVDLEDLKFVLFRYLNTNNSFLLVMLDQMWFIKVVIIEHIQLLNGFGKHLNRIFQEKNEHFFFEFDLS
jgi:hypothetical protein